MPSFCPGVRQLAHAAVTVGCAAALALTQATQAHAATLVPGPARHRPFSSFRALRALAEGDAGADADGFAAQAQRVVGVPSDGRAPGVDYHRLSPISRSWRRVARFA